MIIGWLLCGFTMWADQPFRNHRYDVFKVLPVKRHHIVFMGNSITNMFEWWEAFGSDQRILNRGVSGAVTAEALANAEFIAKGKPAKVFLMMGTNDLGTKGMDTPEQVVENVRQLVDCFQRLSPKTQLYIQSILPSKSGIRTLEKEMATNRALQALCKEKSITYIDLWDDLISISENTTHTMDGLHLKASGYAIWCQKIQSYLGIASQLSSDVAACQQSGGSGGSYGMRNTYFSVLPVCPGDVLLIGDEMIHGGEWHELLQSKKIKNRGTGWGYPGPSLERTLQSLPCIFHSSDGNCDPAAVCLYAGVSDVNGSADLAIVVEKYIQIVTRIREYAPHTPIYVMGLQPTANAAVNSNRVQPFNAALQKIAGTTYIDLYTGFEENGIASPAYFEGNYLYGKGYLKVAGRLAKALNIKGVKAVKGR